MEIFFYFLKKNDNCSYCLPFDLIDHDKSSTGPCMDMNNITNFTWTSLHCATRFTILPIIVMVCYLAFFSIGWYEFL